VTVEAWIAKSGEVEMALRGAELFASLPGGERHARDGAARAERLGFSLFRIRLLRLAGETGEADRLAKDLGYCW
jgi:hypothetical protein